jgi:hypothetical protein
MNDTDKMRRDVDAYTATIDRLEPDIAMIDASAFYASAAISLKRIADHFDNQKRLRELVDIIWQHATENTNVPSTKTADMLIDRWRKS